MESLNEVRQDVMSGLADVTNAVKQIHGRNHVVQKEIIHKIDCFVKKIFDFSGLKIPSNYDSMSDKIRSYLNANEVLLDKVGRDLDKAEDVNETDVHNLIDTSVVTLTTPINTNSGNQTVLRASRNVEKPQVTYNMRIDNTNAPFIPILKEKPHSLKPMSILLCLDDAGREFYNHPYEYELVNWTTPTEQLQSCTPVDPLPMDSTPLTIIHTIEGVQTLISELIDCSEIAVDLEHNWFRSFLGITCLMQLSSRTKDYIVDTLALKGKLDCLNEIFANPKIVKVFHGASMDILWLQRDLGIYVVNMFDTYEAALSLNYNSKSLANLLSKFCGITANKTYQRADWRIRPLPKDFIEYARQDTHYLLFIFDKMKNELISEGNGDTLLFSVYNRSTSTCLKRYEKPMYTDTSHLNLYNTSRITLNSRQRFAFKALYGWRDAAARERDESIEFVLPNHMLIQLAERLPKDVQGIHACCNPMPHEVLANKLIIHQIILEARRMPMEEVETKLRKTTKKKTLYNHELKIEPLSHFDFSLTEENATGLPTLLGNNLNSLLGQKLLGEKKNTKKRKFNLISNFSEYSNKKQKVVDINFVAPYQRYITIITLTKLRENNPKVDENRVQKMLQYVTDLRNNNEEEEEEDEESPQEVTRNIQPYEVNSSFANQSSFIEDESDEESVMENPEDKVSSFLKNLRNKVSKEEKVEEDKDQNMNSSFANQSSIVEDESDDQSVMENPEDKVSSFLKNLRNKVSTEEKVEDKDQNMVSSFLKNLRNKVSTEEKVEEEDKDHNMETEENTCNQPLPKKMSINKMKQMAKNKGKKHFNHDVNSKKNENLQNSSDQVKVEQEITPFNYEAADKSVFNQKKKKNARDKIEEKFKFMKNRNPAMKKSGLKSYSWGKK